MSKYQVAYQGQIITEPLDLQTATQIAVEENLDAVECGHEPLAEVVLAPNRDE
jgi:hypothetical protein